MWHVGIALSEELQDTIPLLILIQMEAAEDLPDQELPLISLRQRCKIRVCFREHR